MTLQGRRVAVSLPDTVLEDKDSPRDKTAKLGLIARACAIYGIDTVEIFRDPTGKGEGAAMRRVLEYLETPQYLRKRLFPLDDTLRYAGLLPPLRIPSHKPKVDFDSLAPGETREGIANADGTVDIGLETAPKLESRAPAGSRVTVELISVRPPKARIMPRSRVLAYWGYEVEEKSASEVLSDGRFTVKVATSRLGAPITDVLSKLGGSLRRSGSVKVIFGSPSRGLFDIFGKELGSKVDYVVNLFPEQHVETVRTEEAVFVGLGILSLVSTEKA